MFSKVYIGFVKALLDSTSQGTINWEKGNSHLAYKSPTLSRGEVVVLDKYYSIFEGKQVTCVNVSIFDANDKLQDEVVRCTLFEEDTQPDYELLLELYKAVYLQFNQRHSHSISPMITNITQSLQEKLHQ